MTPDEAHTEFLARIESKHPSFESSEARGASNAPYVLDGGFRFGLYNIDKKDYKGLNSANRALVLVTQIFLPPDNLLHLAMVFEGEAVRHVGERRDEIARQARDGKANKVRVYINRQGVFLAQEDLNDVLGNLGAEAGRAISPSVVYFADFKHEGDLAPIEVEYVKYFTNLLAPVPIARLKAAGTLGGRSIDPSAAEIEELCGRIRSLGGYFDNELVGRYHVALNHHNRKHFVLLTGISGTGKTLLAKSYAYAVLGVSDLQLPAEHFKLIPVRPDWTEPVHLLGFKDAISNGYARTPFLDALLLAIRQPERPVFVCLDELNLAQPEHYMADILSAMETGEPIKLHSESSIDGVPGQVAWPRNLYLTGTVNVDETTRAFSPKVLDRANVIEMSEVDVQGFCDDLARRDPRLSQAMDPDTVTLLAKLCSILRPYHLHFGNRVIEEVARYKAFAEEKGVFARGSGLSAREGVGSEYATQIGHAPAQDSFLLSGRRALDIQIEQKILTKLRGGTEHRPMLEELGRLLQDYPLAKATLSRMRDQLERYESFQYWS